MGCAFLRSFSPGGTRRKRRADDAETENSVPVLSSFTVNVFSPALDAVTVPSTWSRGTRCACDASCARIRATDRGPDATNTTRVNAAALTKRHKFITGIGEPRIPLVTQGTTAVDYCLCNDL